MLVAILMLTIAAAPAHAQDVSQDIPSAPAVYQGRTFEGKDVILVEPEAPPAPVVYEGKVFEGKDVIIVQREASPAVEMMPADAVTERATETHSESAPTNSIDQVIYKGVVGNLLEVMPLDPEQRVQLQRGNAILNNAFAGRSIALLLGVASPPLMIAGLIWGIWSATRIKSAPVTVAPTAVRAPEPEVKAQEAAPADGEAVANRKHVAAQSTD
jgi:hypothetical protein